MMAMLWLIGGLGLGWGLAEILGNKTTRDVPNRGRGVVAELRSRAPRTVPDDVLVRRVRARLGGSVRHPRSINVAAQDGRVTLSGPVLADELGDLLARVAAVRGVRDLDNKLEVHAEPGDVPGLQGAGRRRRRRGGQFEVLPRTWPPAARLGVGLAAGALVLSGLRRRGVVGSIIGVGGGALLARAVSNLEHKRVLGVGASRSPVTTQKLDDGQTSVRGQTVTGEALG